jgi:uncharacterized protein YgbK (DUF1537 family)
LLNDLRWETTAGVPEFLYPLDYWGRGGHPTVVQDAQSKMGQRGAATRAETILGEVAVRLRESGVRRFLIAGGETSGAVLNHLGVRQLKVGAHKAPGISHASSYGSPSLAFCLKSGKLGPEDMLLPMLDRMEQGEV